MNYQHFASTRINREPTFSQRVGATLKARQGEAIRKAKAAVKAAHEERLALRRFSWEVKPC